MSAEDLDPVDAQAVEVHEGHSVDLIVSVRLTPDDSRLLADLEEREGSDAVAILRAALREYARVALGPLHAESGVVATSFQVRTAVARSGRTRS